MPRDDIYNTRRPGARPAGHTQLPPLPVKKDVGRPLFYAFMAVLTVVLAVVIVAASTGAVPALNPKATAAAGASAGASSTPGPSTMKDVPVITEVMASNSGAITAEDGSYGDWIELYNPTDKTLNLSGFALSDNLKRPRKFVFPTWTLEPGEYTLVFADKGTSTATELHAGFKLSSAGSTVMLMDPNGQLVQQVPCPLMKENASYSLDADGNWAVTAEYTPGYPNTKEGYGSYMQTRTAKADVCINEVMAGNRLTLKDGDGDYSDWVELYNDSDKAADITGWGLSDKVGEPKRWVFPKLILEPHQYAVVFLSGKNRSVEGRELHADFKLDSYQDTVLLSNLRGLTVSTVKVSDMGSDVSLALVPGTDRWQAYSHPTPGFVNNEEGWNKLQPSLYADSGSPIVISEVMSNNASTAKDQFDEYPDWIEIYNRSGEAKNLKGYALTDKTGELGRWQFPDITLGAGQYLTVFASGRNLKDGEAVSSGKLHTDFALGGAGGIIVLTAPDGMLADRCFLPALRVGISYGRTDQTQLFSYITSPTPGAANGGGLPGQTPEPVFSLAAGVYTDVQQVALSCSDTQSKIYYTVNGDPPTDKSTPYTGPIEVKKPSAALGGTVIRAAAYRDGYLPSNAVCSTYIIENGVEIALPVLSISVDNKAMFDETTGMYMKGPGADNKFPFEGANFWKDMEIPVHIELIEQDGTVGISQDAGIQIAGQFSRGDVYKSFDIIARSSYGMSSFDYEIFPDLPYTSYKSFVSRPGGQDVKMTGMRDILVGSLARDTIPMDSSGGPSVFVQGYRTALEFVNGEFWGVTHIREKIDEHTLAAHYPGVDETKIDLIDTNGSAKIGSNKDYKDLIEYVQDHDLSNAENYKYVTDRMDIDSYINWFTMELCVGNSDYGNIRLWRSPNLDNKWRWIFYDFCWTYWAGFVDPQNDRYMSDISLNVTSKKAKSNGYLIRALLGNQEFKDKFLKQLAYNITVTYETERALQRIDEIAAIMKPYMEAESQKWSELSKANASTRGYANWDGQVENLRKYARKHPDLLKQEMKKYFNLSDDQMKQLFPN